MPCFDQTEQRSSRKGRANTIEITAKPRLRKNQLQVSGQRARKLDRAGACLNQIRQLGKNARDLISLFFLQPDQFIVHLENGKGFHKHSCSTRGTAVNNAVHATLLLRSDGNHKPSISNCDDLFL